MHLAMPLRRRARAGGNCVLRCPWRGPAHAAVTRRASTAGGAGHPPRMGAPGEVRISWALGRGEARVRRRRAHAHPSRSVSPCSASIQTPRAHARRARRLNRQGEREGHAFRHLQYAGHVARMLLERFTYQQVEGQVVVAQHAVDAPTRWGAQGEPSAKGREGLFVGA